MPLYQKESLEAMVCVITSLSEGFWTLRYSYTWKECVICLCWCFMLQLIFHQGWKITSPEMTKKDIVMHSHRHSINLEVELLNSQLASRGGTLSYSFNTGARNISTDAEERKESHTVYDNIWFSFKCCFRILSLNSFWMFFFRIQLSILLTVYISFDKGKVI